MASKRAILFGTGSFAEVVDFYLGADSDYRVEAFTVSADALASPSFLGRPVTPFETVEAIYPPAEYDMFVAVGYAKLNRVRERFCGEARAKGYRLLNYVCSKATQWGRTEMGDNIFVFEDNSLQPFTAIGDGTILWSGNHIGHHSRIGRHCFITSSCRGLGTLPGGRTLLPRCELGNRRCNIDRQR